MKLNLNAIFFGMALFASNMTTAETLLPDVFEDTFSVGDLEESDDGISVKISQLESIVSEQLRSELEFSLETWFESLGTKVIPAGFEVFVDPLIELVDEPRIIRVIVEVNFSDTLSDETVAGLTKELSAVLMSRGYQSQSHTHNPSGSRTPTSEKPLAYVEVNAPRLALPGVALDQVVTSSVTPSVAATVASENPIVLPRKMAEISEVAVSDFPEKLRKSLLGATAFFLVAIIVLVAFVLRQVRTESPRVAMRLADLNSPKVDYDSIPQTSNSDTVYIERGKSMKLSRSLAHMNFEQALGFLGGMDRARRRAVLTNLPVHQSIKVRLAKALQQRHLVNHC